MVEKSWKSAENPDLTPLAEGVIVSLLL